MPARSRPTPASLRTTPSTPPFAAQYAAYTPPCEAPITTCPAWRSSSFVTVSTTSIPGVRDARSGRGQVLVNAEIVAFGIPEPGGLPGAEHADVVHGLRPGHVLHGQHRRDERIGQHDESPWDAGLGSEEAVGGRARPAGCTHYAATRECPSRLHACGMALAGSPW